jgi:D-inositol-3-phosphate glycosyltransferase
MWMEPRRAAVYAAHLARAKFEGSRREILRNLLRYRQFLEYVRPDIIHVQHPLERCLYVRIVQRVERLHIPLVVTAHSLFGEHSDSTIHKLMAPNLRAADRVIAVSEHIAEQAVQVGVDSTRVRVIRSGVDVARFRPRDRTAARVNLGINPEQPVVLFVGNLEPRKQVDVLLRAAADVRLSLPDLRVIVVGSGESAGVQDQTARLVRLWSELNLQETVEFARRVDDEQLLDYYAAADVFALPSSSEAQGIVALEAMACGLPVIATAVGGLLGTLEDGKTGWLVPSGDVEALANRIRAAFTDTETRRHVAAGARQHIERNFTWTRAVDATIAVYREVLGCP